MLRTSVTLPVLEAAQAGQDDDEGEVTSVRRASLSVVTHNASQDRVAERKQSDHDDELARKEHDETNQAYMWSLLLATLAECMYACFLPDCYILSWNVNATATMINFAGPFMDGLSYGFEQLQKSRANSVLLPCLQFRAAFLGVFTSYSYMVDHAGDLSTSNVLAGPVYICTTIFGACLSFHAGNSIVQAPASRRVFGVLASSEAVGKLPSFLFASTVFILLTVIRAIFGRPGFVQDLKEPQFIGSIRVADGEELILGIFMSCSGILISDYLDDRFRPRPNARGRVSFLDWGNLMCNFVSCWLTCLAYEASKLSPNEVKNNLLVMKFVSCFCGSISSFSAGISHIMLLWQAGNRYGAMLNLILHIVTGLLFLPYLRKSELAT